MGLVVVVTGSRSSKSSGCVSTMDRTVSSDLFQTSFFWLQKQPLFLDCCAGSPLAFCWRSGGCGLHSKKESVTVIAKQFSFLTILEFGPSHGQTRVPACLRTGKRSNKTTTVRCKNVLLLEWHRRWRDFGNFRQGRRKDNRPGSIASNRSKSIAGSAPE